LERYRSWRLRLAHRHLNARVWTLMNGCRCVWQVDDNSEDFGVGPLLCVAPLEPALFAQHRMLLVVGKGFSVTGPRGGGLSSKPSRLPAAPPLRVGGVP
jgi:hypothetical protein